MNNQTIIIDGLKKLVVDAVQTKVPEHFQKDARLLFPDLGKLIHGAIAHYKPQTTETLLQQLQDNKSPGGRLLVELLTEKTPHYFIAEVERSLVLRKKGIAKKRQERRNTITKAFDSTVQRIENKLKQESHIHGNIGLLQYLVEQIQVVDVETLESVTHTPFWEQESNRELLKREVDHHIYYFVVRLLDQLRSYDLPEEFMLSQGQCSMVRVATLFVLHEVFHTTLERIKSGTFFNRNTFYGNRGDRSMDNEIFLNPKRKKGLSALFGDIKKVYDRD